LTNSRPKARLRAAGQKGGDRIDALMQDGLHRQVFPGAVLLAGVDGEVVLHRAYGMADLFSKRPVTLDTCFDLASLTKPLATAAACMVLVQQGRLELDRPCTEILPGEYRDDKHTITPRHLLNHRSGLPAWRPYYLRLQHLSRLERAAAINRWIQAEPLNFLPGDKENYSDLGYLMLQHMVETTSGMRLDHFVRQRIYDPLDLASLFFVDLSRDGSAQGDVAATELCPWRNRLLCGQVHDDNAYAAGGIAGHAGLFGTAMAVFELLQILLMADRREAGQTVFDAAVVRTFWRHLEGYRYALGFDTPSAQDSSAGQYFPADSVGHLGFTGTSFWIHRSKRIAVVLLTNRVHPSRFNLGIKAFRPKLHDVLMEEILR
jgi:CubicO group peptidase (beta-lactamase class C family)